MSDVQANASFARCEFGGWLKERVVRVGLYKMWEKRLFQNLYKGDTTLEPVGCVGEVKIWQ